MARVRLKVVGRPFRGMPVGYEFGASGPDARALLALNRAVRAEGGSAEAAPAPPKKSAKKTAAKKATTRTYKRRDMQAEG